MDEQAIGSSPRRCRANDGDRDLRRGHHHLGRALLWRRLLESQAAVGVGRSDVVGGLDVVAQIELVPRALEIGLGVSQLLGGALVGAVLARVLDDRFDAIKRSLPTQSRLESNGVPIVSA